MRIKVVGKVHLQGTSKKTGNPYDFIQIHYLGKAPGVEGNAALTLNLDPKDYPYDKIAVFYTERQLALYSTCFPLLHLLS